MKCTQFNKTTATKTLTFYNDELFISKTSARVSQLSEREKHFENTNYPNQSRCKAPADWLRTTMARIVPLLTLAKTEDHSYTLHLTSYTLHLTGRSRIFLHRAFFARHYSLPPRQPSVFARQARWQWIIIEFEPEEGRKRSWYGHYY